MSYSIQDLDSRHPKYAPDPDYDEPMVIEHYNGVDICNVVSPWALKEGYKCQIWSGDDLERFYTLDECKKFIDAYNETYR